LVDRKRICVPERGARLDEALMAGGNHSWNDDNEDQNNDASNEAHPHLHVLPPHLLANPVRTSSEALGRLGQVVGLVL